MVCISVVLALSFYMIFGVYLCFSQGWQLTDLSIGDIVDCLLHRTFLTLLDLLLEVLSVQEISCPQSALESIGHKIISSAAQSAEDGDRGEAEGGCPKMLFDVSDYPVAVKNFPEAPHNGLCGCCLMPGNKSQHCR